MIGKTYTGDGWEIRCGRWQDSAPGSVDVVISDPPYDARTHAGGRTKTAGWRKRTLDRQAVVRGVKGFAPIDPADTGPPLVARSLRWVVLFCSVEQLGLYQAASPDEWIRGGLYLKPNPQPQLSGDRPATPGDGVAIMHRKGRKRWNGGGHSARWVAPPVQGKDRHHETQKPVALMLDLVRLFSEPGELVWDPYCGSGTTGVACLRLGRRFLGHEMQPHYAEIAAERLDAETRGLTLQDARAGQTSIFDLEEGGS